MKYFVTDSERKGTCYHEFYRGKWDGAAFWREDSLYLHDDVLVSNQGFVNALMLVIPDYNPCGETEVTAADWEKIGKLIRQDDSDSLELYEEAAAWAEEVFKSADRFTILGI